MIKSLVIVGSIIIFTNCNSNNVKVWSPNLKKMYQRTLGDSRPKQTLPPSTQYCKTIEYMNESAISLSITSLYENNFIIDANKMIDESANLLEDVVETNCKNIADRKGVKFGFEYDASRKTCMCAYGEKR